jgi:hypothetical protein
LEHKDTVNFKKQKRFFGAEKYLAQKNFFLYTQPNAGSACIT